MVDFCGFFTCTNEARDILNHQRISCTGYEDKVKITTEVVGGAVKFKVLSYHKVQSHQTGGFSGQRGRWGTENGITVTGGLHTAMGQTQASWPPGWTLTRPPYCPYKCPSPPGQQEPDPEMGLLLVSCPFPASFIPPAQHSYDTGSYHVRLVKKFTVCKRESVPHHCFPVRQKE